MFDTKHLDLIQQTIDALNLEIKEFDKSNPNFLHTATHVSTTCNFLKETKILLAKTVNLSNGKL